MSLSNNQITSKVAAELVGVSVPTLFRFAGTKVGVDGVAFPIPERLTARLFGWDHNAINAWVAANGRAPETKRGRPKGSTRNRNVSYQAPTQPENANYSFSDTYDFND
jgi:predicted DNA-binding transcriptional regulator AlpA